MLGKLSQLRVRIQALDAEVAALEAGYSISPEEEALKIRVDLLEVIIFSLEGQLVEMRRELLKRIPEPPPSA